MPSKGTTTQRGYGQDHQKMRARYLALVKSGEATCWRCGSPIKPGQQWDLGHDDHDRRKYRGPEHALKNDCPEGGNRATRGRQRHADTSRAW